MSAIIAAAVWGWITTTLMQIWGWIVAGGIAILAMLFSPSIRKYTIAALVAIILLATAYIVGYSSNHNVELVQHACTEFSKLLKGPATEIDKIVSVFRRKGLCE